MIYTNARLHQRCYVIVTQEPLLQSRLKDIINAAFHVIFFKRQMAPKDLLYFQVLV